MVTTRHGATTVIAGMALVAGCGQGTAQCAPCPPPAYVELVSADGGPSSGDLSATARICVEGLGCEDASVAGGTLTLRFAQVTPKQLDGRTVTVSAASAAALPLHGSGVLAYREEHGTCSCSGARARVTLAALDRSDAPPAAE